MSEDYLDLKKGQRVSVSLKTKEEQTANLQDIAKKISLLVAKKLIDTTGNSLKDEILPLVSVVSRLTMEHFAGNDRDLVAAIEASEITKRLFEYSALFGFVLSEIMKNNELTVEATTSEIPTAELAEIEKKNIITLALMTAEMTGIPKSDVVRELLNKEIISEEEAYQLGLTQKDAKVVLDARKNREN